MINHPNRSKRRVPKTNEEFMRDLMRFSPHGSLAQAFIMQAVECLAQTIASMPLEQLTATMQANGSANMIRPAAWHGVATDIAAKFKEFWGHESE